MDGHTTYWWMNTRMHRQPTWYHNSLPLLFLRGIVNRTWWVANSTEPDQILHSADTTFCSIWSGSPLFAQASVQILRFIWEKSHYSIWEHHVHAVSPEPQVSSRPNFSQRTRHVALLKGQACTLKDRFNRMSKEPISHGVTHMLQLDSITGLGTNLNNPSISVPCSLKKPIQASTIYGTFLLLLPFSNCIVSFRFCPNIAEIKTWNLLVFPKEN